MRSCLACSIPLAAGERGRYCSQRCRVRNSRNMRSPTKGTDFERTDLNRLTDGLYAACNGAHQPSDRSVYRDLGQEQRWIPVCGLCGVPITGKVQGFNRKFTTKETEEAA